jgi:hypothetical protein
MVEPMEVQPINTTATNKKEQQAEKSKSTAKKRGTYRSYKPQ